MPCRSRAWLLGSWLLGWPGADCGLEASAFHWKTREFASVLSVKLQLSSHMAS
jgi:hypothetical protein